MKVPRLLIFANAFDDKTRSERGVTTDSPAGSRKVFLMAQALRANGVQAWVISMGRGRAGGPVRFYPGHACRVNGVPVVYAPFLTFPVLSELLSLIAFIPTIFRFRNTNRKAALFYNRLAAHLLSLITSRALGYSTFLDLEDGEIEVAGFVPMRAQGRRVVANLYDKLCKDGALLACNALAAWTKIRPTICYYGTATGDGTPPRLTGTKVTVLMSGALVPGTGAELLVAAIQRMRSDGGAWSDHLEFVVTGFGASLNAFRQLAEEPTKPLVHVYGRTSDAEYRSVLSKCDVGLALKLPESVFAHTTFPSKVIEFSAAGLLVVTTDISDVRAVLGDDGAMYLMLGDPDQLIGLLKKIVESPTDAIRIAETGMVRVKRSCDPLAAGRLIAEFMFGAS